MVSSRPLLVVASLATFAACATPPSDPEPIVLSDDGGWCWFQDERAIVHGGKLIFGSVAAGLHDPARRGDVEVVTYDLATGRTTRSELHDRLQLDDHAAPAFAVLPDGHLLAIFARHGSDRLIRYRISALPGVPIAWDDERTFEIGRGARAGATYSNVFVLAAENDGRGRVYDFYRGEGWDPNFIVSDDAGRSWRYGGKLLGGPGRPYLKYASNGTDTIHFVATEQHPRDFDNSIFHGFVRGGRVFRSDGTPVGELGASIGPADLTRVFAGDADHVAWTVDLHLDREGRPFVAYSVQTDGHDRPKGEGGLDCRYRYARWDGRRWIDHELAHAGTKLYAGEDDYTGLVALDPDDPNAVYISTDADPRTGEPLISAADGRRHYEIFAGTTRDFGASWSWRPITKDSTADNIRPIVPMWNARETAVLWLRGEMRSYTDYGFEVVGVLFDAER